jgi:hypothetical protein
MPAGREYVSFSGVAPYTMAAPSAAITRRSEYVDKGPVGSLERAWIQDAIQRGHRAEVVAQCLNNKSFAPQHTVNQLPIYSQGSGAAEGSRGSNGAVPCTRRRSPRPDCSRARASPRACAKQLDAERNGTSRWRPLHN